LRRYAFGESSNPGYGAAASTEGTAEDTGSCFVCFLRPLLRLSLPRLSEA
jgi:hypothetical protein